MIKTVPTIQITNSVVVRRIKPNGVARLKAKIERLGLLPQYPLLVSENGDGGYTLIDGRHRLEALRSLGIEQVAVYVVSLNNEADMLRRARQANEAAESVVYTTFVDDAELIWRESDAGRTQEEIGDILGWSRVKVKNYAALRKIDPNAWDVIGTTFENAVPSNDEDAVPLNGTAVPFTENLLRAILDLTPDQQLSLVTDLAEGTIKKAQFKAMAAAYQARNEMKAYVAKELAGVGDDLLQEVFTEIDRGGYDKDWRDPQHPKLNRLIQALREEWEQKAGTRIILGDFEVEVPGIPDDSVDVVLTDPPFGISGQGKLTKKEVEFVPADFDGEDGWDSVEPEHFLGLLEGWVRQWARITRPGGAVISFCDKVLVSELSFIVTSPRCRRRVREQAALTHPCFAP